MSDARQSLPSTSDAVERDETLYLMRGANGRRLRRSIERLEAGHTRLVAPEELGDDD